MAEEIDAADAWARFASVPPLPQPDELTEFFWQGARDHRLLIQRCQDCGHHIHEPRPWCRLCLSKNLAPVEVSGRAVLDTYTIPLQPSHPYFVALGPYILAVVELEEQSGLKMITNIVNCAEEDLAVGMPLRVLFREVDDEITLPYFEPA